MSSTAKVCLTVFLGIVTGLIGLGVIVVHASHLEHLAAINAGLHQEVVEGIAVWVKPRVEQCRCKRPGAGETYIDENTDIPNNPLKPMSPEEFKKLQDELRKKAKP